MTVFPGPLGATTSTHLDAIVHGGEVLGRDIVEVAAFLDDLDGAAHAQLEQIGTARSAANTVAEANARVHSAVDEVTTSAEATMAAVADSARLLREAGVHTKSVASWVQAVGTRMADVAGTLNSVKDSNTGVARIASQVIILAINAKIEAVRAGEAGRGFAVIAEAINELSRQTTDVAATISEAISGLRQQIDTLRAEAEAAAAEAGAILDQASETDRNMTEMVTSVEATRRAAIDISQRANEVRAANEQFAPSFRSLTDTTQRTANGVHEARERVDNLVTLGEAMVQNSVMAGGTHADSALIAFVRQSAERIGQMFDEAIETGRIRREDLFDHRYAAIPGTSPQQVLAPFTRLTDAILPAVQEPALALDPRIVFCAAVDVNGYLPTHNAKYSQPQSRDPVWNAANCRNRRIFDDRVGLRAGRSTAPFLIQVYRRDMGGGNFVLMKDLSAPIRVGNRHWGGFRMGYRF